MVERYERDRLRFLLDAVDEYGPVVTLAPGTVLVADPAAAHDVLRQTNSGFLVSQNFMREEIAGRRGSAMLEDRMAGRRAAMAAMTPHALDSHTRWLRHETEELCAKWLRLGTVTSAVDDLRALMSRSFTRFCFGDRDAVEITIRTSALLDALFPIQSSPIRPPQALRRILPRYRRARSAHLALAARLNAFAAAPGSGGLVDVMAESGMPRASVVHMLVSLCIASQNVPAAAVAWLLAECARNMDLTNEMAEDGSGQLLRWAIEETLRMWPPTWLIFRSTEASQTCGQWHIPAGSAVMVSPYVLHRTAACFARPSEFLPRRWRGLKPPLGAYIPFGAGPRRCVGAHFAMSEIREVAAVLLARLRLRPQAHAQASTPDVRTTLTPADLVLRVTARA